MKKIFHLATCNTNKKIIARLNGGEGFDMQEIKSEPITEEQIDQMKEMAGSYEALFSRRSMKYRKWGLHEKELTEKDYRDLILKEYTFLKRPVIIIEDEIFVGNAKKEVEGAVERVKGKG